MKNIKKIIILVLACASFVIVTGTTNNAFANSKNSVSTKQKANFARGAKLWSSRCGSCHNLRDPKDATDREWEMIVKHMRIRAGLSGQDSRDIIEFLKRSN